MTDPNDPRHGTLNGYTNLGCRCDSCREAQRARQLEYMHRNEWQRRLHASREALRYVSGHAVNSPGKGYVPPSRRRDRT